MPLYEYECAACHRRTEKIQKFSDAELTVCPFCGGALARTITAPAIQFKGAGWYKDLYSSAKPPTVNTGSEGGSSPAGEAGSSEKGKGESGPSNAPAPTAAPATSAPAATGTASSTSNT